MQNVLCHKVLRWTRWRNMQLCIYGASLGGGLDCCGPKLNISSEGCGRNSSEGWAKSAIYRSASVSPRGWPEALNPRRYNKSWVIHRYMVSERRFFLYYLESMLCFYSQMHVYKHKLKLAKRCPAISLPCKIEHGKLYVSRTFIFVLEFCPLLHCNYLHICLSS